MTIVQTVLAILGGLIGVITFLGVFVTFLRRSGDQGTIVSLQSSVNALETENKIKDDKIERIERERRAADARIASLSTEVEVLRQVVTQEKAIHKMQATLDQFRVESMAVLHLIEQGRRDHDV